MASLKDDLQRLFKKGSDWTQTAVNENPEILIRVIEKLPSDTRRKVLGSFCSHCYNRFYGRCDCKGAQ